MRHLLLAAFPLAALASPVLAQDVPPRVLFCSGPCFAVDNNGTRTAVSKGAPLRPGQRLETGPGAYAQVKLANVALGLAENTRVRFDPNAISLDQGRLRAITGTHPGAVPGAAVALPIRTPDGDLSLRGADVEIKKSVEPGTLVKLNAGDAIVRSPAGEIALPREGVQSLQAGRPTVAPAAVSRQMVLVSVRPPATGAPAAPGLPTTGVVTVRPPLVTAFTPQRAPAILPPPPPILRPVEALPNLQLTNTLTGQTQRLGEVVQIVRTAPTTTFVTSTLPTTTSPTTLTEKQTFTVAPSTTTRPTTINFTTTRIR